MPTVKSAPKGYALEEELREAFRRAGYFVLAAVPFRIAEDDVTDVDLWLYERPVASSRRRIIVDIKNRKSPKAAERIIWTKGLQAALGVDGAMVATTDRRPASRRLARTVGITLLDGQTIAELTASNMRGMLPPLSWMELSARVKSIDDARKSSEWRGAIQAAQGSMLSGFGVQSTNTTLSIFGFFAHQAVSAQPNSDQAEVALRMSYLVAALACISLDFVLAAHILNSETDRKAAITNSVRFGQSDVNPSLSAVRTAIALARKYADGGTAVARQIDLGFRSDADQIPAEIIADFALRMKQPDGLFSSAVDLEGCAHRRLLPSFDENTVGARAALGAFLDFSGVSRMEFAHAWRPSPNGTSGQPPAATAGEAGPLFEGPERERATDP